MIATLLLAAALQAGASAGDPGPRTGIAGLGGFRTVSRIDFGTSQNRLTAIYLFPDRARWHFENYAAKERSEHQFVYRLGARVAEFGNGKPSAELDDASRDVVVLQMELRRAAMLWPDGFEWAELDARTRTAAVHLDSAKREQVLGSLVAVLADGGRPGRIEARDTADHVVETLEVKSWQEHGGRSWPATLAVGGASGGFVETVESIDTRIHYLDLSFRPPDRRDPAAVAKPGEVLPRDLVAMTYAVHPLPTGTGWDTARERARAWIAEARSTIEPLGHAVDPVPTFELGSDGLPESCLVRLAAPAFPAPEGYETRHERLGVFLPLQELRQADRAVLERLRRAVPADARPGIPYLRLHDRAQLPVELVLPFEPKE